MIAPFNDHDLEIVIMLIKSYRQISVVCNSKV